MNNINDGTAIFNRFPSMRRRWVNAKEKSPYWIKQEELLTQIDVIEETPRDLEVNDIPRSQNVEPGSHSERLAFRGVGSLHVVYFATEADPTADIRALESTLHMMSGRYEDIHLHQFPCTEDDWPSPLISNMRDAALLSQQLPEGYTSSDVLMFVHNADPSRPAYETSGHAMACLAAAHIKGSSFDILTNSNNQISLTFNGIQKQEVTDDSIDSASPDYLTTGGEEENQERTETGNKTIVTYKDFTLAVTCEHMARVADEILKLVTEHYVEPDEPFPDVLDHALLKSIIGCLHVG